MDNNKHSFYLGIHVGREHIFIVDADALIPPQIISHLSPTELDAGAGHHPEVSGVMGGKDDIPAILSPGSVVGGLLPHPKESVKTSACWEEVFMTETQVPLANCMRDIAYLLELLRQQWVLGGQSSGLVPLNGSSLSPHGPSISSCQQRCSAGGTLGVCIMSV